MFFISDAMAQTAGGADGGAIMMQIIPLILIFAVFWFFLIRPQQKRQKEHQKLVSELGKGDEVLTAGGLSGRISDISDLYVVLEICRIDNKPVTITIQRAAVQAVLPKGTLKSV